jgi:hypothetical protein
MNPNQVRQGKVSNTKLQLSQPQIGCLEAVIPSRIDKSQIERPRQELRLHFDLREFNSWYEKLDLSSCFSARELATITALRQSKCEIIACLQAWNSVPANVCFKHCQLFLEVHSVGSFEKAPMLIRECIVKDAFHLGDWRSMPPGSSWNNPLDQSDERLVPILGYVNRNTRGPVPKKMLKYLPKWERKHLPPLDSLDAWHTVKNGYRCYRDGTENGRPVYCWRRPK